MEDKFYVAEDAVMAAALGVGLLIVILIDKWSRKNS